MRIESMLSYQEEVFLRGFIEKIGTRLGRCEYDTAREYALRRIFGGVAEIVKKVDGAFVRNCVLGVVAEGSISDKFSSVSVFGVWKYTAYFHRTYRFNPLSLPLPVDVAKNFKEVKQFCQKCLPYINCEERKIDGLPFSFAVCMYEEVIEQVGAKKTLDLHVMLKHPHGDLAILQKIDTTHWIL